MASAFFTFYLFTFLPYYICLRAMASAFFTFLLFYFFTFKSLA